MSNRFQCLINGIEYDIVPSVKIKEVLNEELDTGTIVIPFLTEEQDFQKGDIVRLIITDTIPTSNSFIKVFLINSFTSREQVINTPKQIEYTIDLISPAMWLQNIILPNKSNTISLITTVKPKTCAEYVSILLQLYGDSKIVLDNATYQLLNTKICPEFQWNKPNLWEVLRDIFSVFNYVPTIAKLSVVTGIFTLSHLDLNQTNTISDATLPNDFEIYQTADNYAKAIDIKIENGINNYVFAKTFKWEAVKSTDGLVNTENATMITPFNIYTLKKLVVTFDTSDTDYSSDGDGFSYTVAGTVAPYTPINRHIDEIDITDYVVEKEIYNTKLVSNKTSAQDFDETLKRFFLYFEKGKNEIGGMTYQDSTFFNISTNPAIYQIIVAYLKDYAANDENGFYELPLTYTKVLKYKWYAEYGTQNSDRIKVIKSNGIRNNLVITDGQDNSFVDVDAFVKQKQDLVNRMGEVQANAKALIPSISYLINLGDQIESYKVYSRSILFEKNSINEVIQLSKNLVRRYQNTLLNMDKRFTQIASSSDSFLRQEVKVINMKLITTSASSTFGNIFLTNYNGKTSIIGDDATKHIGRVQYKDNTYSDYFLLESSNKYAGNTCLITTQFMDNYSVGMAYDTDNYALGGTPMSYVKYTDKNGEFKYLQFIPFLGTKTKTDYKLLPKITDFTTIEENNEAMIKKTEQNYLIYKDNREQISITIEFNFESDTSEKVGVFMYSDFVKYCPIFDNTSRVLKAGYIDNDLSLHYEPDISGITEDTTAIILYTHDNSISVYNFNDGETSENYHNNYVLYFEDVYLVKHVILGFQRYGRNTVTFYLVTE